jgi:FMN phosphatase YigB (HAD superfamily)
MIKVIVFDAGGVLIKYNMKRLAKQYSKVLKKRPLLIQKSWVCFLPAVESGKIDVRQFYRNFCLKINIKPNIALLNGVFKKHFSLNKSVFRLSQELKQNYRVGLLSNADARFHDVIRRLLGSNFDFDIVSYKTGYIKPQKEIYDLLIKKAGCRPDEMVFIDDYHHFIDGAKAAGIQGIVYKNLSQLKNDLKSLGVN